MFRRSWSRWELATRAVLTLGVGAAVALMTARGAAQEVTYTGAWQASGLSVRYAVQSWGPDCGPRPGAGSEPGGRVTVSGEGSHLRFSGALTGATNACWSDNAEVRRVAASARGESWSTSCSTVAGNPRGESGRYTFTVRDPNTLAYSERTTYNWQLRESTCTATRTASRTLTRATPLAIPSELPEPTPTPTPAPEPVPTCAAGEPTALRLRPLDDAPVEPGERVCLNVRATDAAGCALPNPRIEWRVTGPVGSAGRMDGRCFVTPPNAAEAEGSYRVTATLAGLEARADITVRSPDLSGLIAVRDRNAPSQPGGIGRAESEDAAGVAAVSSSSNSGRNALLVGVGLLLLAATCGFAVLVLRARRKTSGRSPRDQREDDDDTRAGAQQRDSDPLKNSGTALIPKTAALPTSARQPAPTLDDATAASGGAAGALGAGQALQPHAPSTPMGAGPAEPVTCPVCGVPGTGGERFCAKHGERLLPHSQNPLRSGGMICPACRRGYPVDAEFCPHDRAALVPYSLYRRAEAAPDTLPRICPTCGERYAQHVTFCGKDGASLTSVN